MTETDFTEITRLSKRFYQNPRSKIFVHLADAYRKNNMIDEALEVLKNGLRYHPNYPLAHLIRGKCFFNKTMFAKAKESFEKALELDPQNLVALRMLAQTCELLQDEEGQIIAYRTILGIDPSDDVAKRRFEQLVSSERERPLYTKEEAEEYERRNDVMKALEAYEYLLFLDPSDTIVQEKINTLRQQLEVPKAQEIKLMAEEVRDVEVPEPTKREIEADQESVEPVIETTSSEEMPEFVSGTEREIKIKLHAAGEDDETQNEYLEEESRESVTATKPTPVEEKSQPEESRKVSEIFRPVQHLFSGLMNQSYYPGREDKPPIDIHELINRFFRRKNLFLYVAISVFFIFLIMQLTRSSPPVYRATFDLGVSKEKPVETFFSTPYPSYQETPTVQMGTVTQRVISNLLSVSLAEKVVDTLSLYVFMEEKSPEIHVHVKIKRDFIRPIGPLQLRIIGRQCEIFSGGPVALVYGGQLNEYIDLDSIMLKVVPLGVIPSGKIYQLTIYPRNRMALALRNSLSIKVLEADKIEQEMGHSGVPFSGEAASDKLLTAKTIFPGLNLIGILRINVHWSNPKDAMEIAKALSAQIVQEDISHKSAQYTKSQTFIDSQLTFYQEKLTRLEEQIRQFKGGKRIVDLRASTQALIGQISELESKKNQLQIEQKTLGELSEYLITTAVDASLNFAPTMISDPVLQNFYSQLLNTAAELKGLLNEYSDSHPKVIATRARLDGLKAQMREEVDKRTSTIKTEIASVTSQINMLQRRLDSVPMDEISLARLERDRETAEKLYTFFAEKLEETRVQEAGVTSDIRILNPPLVSTRPVNARSPLKILMLTIIVSICAGAGAVFIADYLDTSVKDPDALKEKIGLPLFASIPVIEDEKAKDKEVLWYDRLKSLIEIVKKKKPDKKLQIISKDISSPDFEAFRKLSINLDFAHPEKRYRVIYITSPGPQEGKTSVALNLGVVFTTMGKKSIVIDTDFRKKKGHLTDITQLEKEEGLFEVLKGEARLKDVIISFNASEGSSALKQPSTLALLPVGKIPPNPFLFLESEKMKSLLGKLKNIYDYIIIDGVPVLLFADASYVARCADGVFLTVRYGRTGFKELENSKNILLASKANIIGIIVNGVSKTRGSYYYQYYQKYYTKYYKQE